MGIYRDFRVREQKTLTFRLEMSNAFNLVPVAHGLRHRSSSAELAIVFGVAGLIADRESLFFRWQALFVFDRQALTRANCGFEFFRPRAHLVVRMARLDLQKEKDCFLDWVPHRLRLLMLMRQGA